MMACSSTGVVWLIPFYVWGDYFRMGSVKLRNKE